MIAPGNCVGVRLAVINDDGLNVIGTGGQGNIAWQRIRMRNGDSAYDQGNHRSQKRAVYLQGVARPKFEKTVTAAAGVVRSVQLWSEMCSTFWLAQPRFGSFQFA